MTEKNGIVSDHQIFLEDRRLPVMKRKLSQATKELGVLEVQKVVASLFGGKK